MRPSAEAPDLLRRFTPTPFIADLNAMGRAIRLESNGVAVLEQTRRHFRGYDEPAAEHPDFAWRIISETGCATESGWPEMTAFSQDGLSYASIGNSGFLAVDTNQREAVAFLPEELVKDTPGFARPFLAMLFSLTSTAIGLTAVQAASVARGGAGLLVFGPPKSGKLMAGYLASHFGFDLHAHEMVFLEASSGGLRAWADFWNPGQPTAHPFVTPAACVFIERKGRGAHRLSPLQTGEFQKRLHEYSRLWEGASSQLLESTAWNLLRSLPAFQLSYSGDPSIPARLFQSLIDDHAG